MERSSTHTTPTYTETSVTCAVCGVKLSASEIARVRSDIDFVEHGKRGHLIRIDVEHQDKGRP